MAIGALIAGMLWPKSNPISPMPSRKAAEFDAGANASARMARFSNYRSCLQRDDIAQERDIRAVGRL
ncbi:hypothetical protein X737_39470 [Mesorhizobium sp. L48C026A00]|nr:hypothetical protein X737_39470 [Mesorhizobium sp. L48C026A00]